ncbi:hypothetical protein TRVL_10331 [Trypanosoma vivax]|nr:hypothetical protein TRVL_10331 [Trypanosoma vivax]
MPAFSTARVVHLCFRARPRAKLTWYFVVVSPFRDSDCSLQLHVSVCVHVNSSPPCTATAGSFHFYFQLLCFPFQDRRCTLHCDSLLCCAQLPLWRGVGSAIRLPWLH